MGPSEIERLILNPLKDLPPDIRQFLSDRIFYVISQQTPLKSALSIAPANFFMRLFSKFKDNDGLVEKQKMFIKDFGRILGTLKADHMDLLVALTLKGLMVGLTTSSDHKNHAFAYLVMKTFLEIVKKQELAEV